MHVHRDLMSIAHDSSRVFYPIGPLVVATDLLKPNLDVHLLSLPGDSSTSSVAPVSHAPLCDLHLATYRVGPGRQPPAVASLDVLLGFVPLLRAGRHPDLISIQA